MRSTFQNIRLFKDQSVLDNVKIGLHNQMSYSTLTGILRLPKYRKVEAEMDEKAMELLKVFDLEREADFLSLQSSIRKAEKAGDCACTCNESKAAAARRAGGRHEPERDERADGNDPFCAG